MSEISEEIKKLPNLLDSSKKNDRITGFFILNKILDSPGLPDGFAKGIAQLLVSIIPLYTDRPSQYMLMKGIEKVTEKFGSAFMGHIINGFATQAQALGNVEIMTSSMSKFYTFPLHIGIEIWINFSKAGVEIKEKEALTLIDAIAVYFALATNEENHHNRRISGIIYKLWSKKKIFDMFTKVFPGEELKVCHITLGGWLLKYTSEKNIDIQPSLKSTLIQAYLKIVLHSRKKPSLFVLKKTSVLLKQITHEEFAEQLLPVAQKSLLRYPEVIMEAVGFLFSSVNLDLSKYVKDVTKVLESPIHAKEDKTREETINVCKQLAKQCSDSSAIQLLIKMLFDVFFGSDGKLTVNSHKISLLQAIENVSYHAVSSTSANYTLSEEVSMKLLKVLETETHEASLLQALRSLCCWVSKFTSEVPLKLIEFFPKGLSLKSSTTLVKAAYCRCILPCINTTTALKFSSAIPVLIQVLDKALSQPSNVLSLTEALGICCVLLKIVSCNSSLESKVSSIWNSALDLKKNYFSSEKFLSQVSSDGTHQLILWCELLLSSFPDKLGNSALNVHFALVWCLVSSYSEARSAAQKAIHKLCSSQGSSIVIQLVSAMTEVASFLKAQKDNDDFVDSGGGVNVVGFVKGLLVICLTKDLEKSVREEVAVIALKIAYHPVVVSEDPNFWLRICSLLEVKPSLVFGKKKAALVQYIMEEFQPTPFNLEYIRGLSLHGASFLLSDLVSHCVAILDDSQFLEVTEEDINIFRTPEGTIYNQKVVDEAFEMELDLKNVKKTTKVYSHKEQVMMLEEKRKELEKKRKEGKLELTAKQKEVMKNQLEKEGIVRERILKLEVKALRPIGLLHSAISGNVDAFYPFMKTLVPILIKYLPSKLIGEKLAWILYDMSSLLDSPHSYKPLFLPANGTLAPTVARTILRVNDVAMKIPRDWSGEEKEEAAIRCITILQAAVTLRDDGELCFLTAAGFTYFYPILEWTLLKCQLDANQKDQITLWGLNIIKSHTSMRGRTSNCICHPKYLPREQLLQLLITIISTREGRVQQTACAVLQDVCVCASGQSGCDRATQDEIYVLLNTLTAPAQSVRDASLRGLNVLIDSLSNLSFNPHTWHMMTHRLYVAKYDEEPDIQNLAKELWRKAKMKVSKDLLSKVLEDVTHPTDAIRSSAAVALSALIKDEGYSVDSISHRLVEIYRKKLQMTPAKKDQYDHIIEDAIDHWEGRAGVGLAIYRIAPLLEEKSINSLAKFFVPESLGDRHEGVRKNMLDAAMAVVNHHGKETVNNLIPVFEKFLSTAPNHAKFDAVRQSVVILMGSLAKHLDQNNPKIKPIVTKLIDALSTPSQQVQEAVANCLHPLVPAIKDDCPKLVSKLMNILLESNNYGQRKGAAYGLASLVKGLGILSLKQLDVMNQLNNAIQDKQKYRYREGSLFAIEQLCNMLGKLFEPYIVYILPHLLLCFGDGNTYVRQAADDTARAVMSKLSAHGVKLVLPSLLAALEEDSWRTKTGSVELLGNMAFCAPKQLSSCLPSIVPRLIEVLSDSHQKVQLAGAQALKLIGSVIRNPEIQAIVPVMLDALQDPGKNTSTCLQTLLETKFVHFIDSPSLALIMPVVQRAFQDRSTEVRKMAAQIIGNMYSLTDQKDLAPYLPSIIPGLKASLLDPVPKVRSVSARALGAMVKGMGEASFDDLLPWLMQTLTSESSPVDRSGAAQGLAEVVGGLGPEKLHKLMPDIVATAERSDIAPHVKDGYIMMFIFLPTVFEEEFTPYIGQIIPPILKALADENEYVRETALRAGQRIVNTYAESAITLLLPELENGLFHDNWRIRFSSVQLLGDLLYRVSGVSGKMTTDTAHEDDNFGTEQSQKAIMTVLGEDRRNRVLAGLYMGRSDVALMVRQAALHVWKVVVTNTPKTLREILPTLFSLLLGCLASTSFDKRQVAARTLGDLVRKLGERVLPEIIPILESGLESPEPDHRQGVCIGLSEIMVSTSRDMVLCFADNLVPTVRRALCDPLPAVREAAAHTFDSLHATVGSRALDDILPHLLAELQSDSDIAAYALDGLKQVMAIKSRVVLPYLIPQLTATPINTEALCILASVAGDTLPRHLNKILPALLAALSDTADTPEYPTVLSHCQEVVLAVSEDGINIIVDTLLQYSKQKSSNTVRASVALLLVFCSNTKVDYTDYAPQLIRGLVQLLTSDDKVTLQTAWNALAAVTKSLDPSDQRALVTDVRQAVKFAASDLKNQTLIPGFCLPKGIQPILPIFREAVLNGEPEHKESAANGLTEVIRLTSSDALKTSVIHITGPLIRILGDRFSWNVKIAVLDTLALLLEKAGPMLKPFLPQLQTTFVKAVHDPHRGVRLKAGFALSHLIVIHTKPDPLFTELLNSVKSVDETALRETMLQAVRSVVGPAGFRMSETVSKGLLSTLMSLIFHETESIRLCTAGALGVLLQWLTKSDVQNVVSHCILDESPGSDYTIKHGKSAALFSALKSAPKQLFETLSDTKVAQNLLSNLISDRVSIVENGVVGVGFFMKYLLLNDKEIPLNVLTTFSKTVNHSNNEIKQAMCRSCQFLPEQLKEEKGDDALVPAYVARIMLPVLVNAAKEFKNPVVRSSSEMSLIAILKMKDNEGPSQEMQDCLEGSARDALLEVINKNLKKATYIPVTQSEMDPSLLT